LAKIINNIDIFRINLSHGDEDTKKKYIDMVVKLDSSKSIMLDTKGPEIRTRNKEEMTLKKNQEISIAYAEFFKHEENTLFIDYPNIHNITPGSIMSIDNDAVSIEILENKQDKLIGKVKHKGIVLINR
jgi:pyruvate kinase